MRKIAFPQNHQYKRLILYECEEGIYLFYSLTTDDYGSFGDAYYHDIQNLYDDCLEEFGIKHEDWQIIDDPLPYCQDDTLDPIRVVGRDIGKPQFDKLEKLVNGSWVPWSRNV